MFKWFIFTVFCGFSSLSFGLEHQMIDTLGTSPKGQYVALEEYGHITRTNSYFVKIYIMNVWTKEYVGKPIQVEIPALKPLYLKEARNRAKILAVDELKRFNIST